MSIKIRKLYPRMFAWRWSSDTRVLLIGLYWFTVGVDFGLKKSSWYNHFFRRCPVCNGELNVNHRMQVVKYHRRCRTEGRRMEMAKIKLLRKEARKSAMMPSVTWWQKIFSHA